MTMTNGGTMIYLLTAIIGVLAGLLGGLLGVGGGLIFVPLFHYVLKCNMHQAIGTSLAVIIPTAFVAAIPNAFSGNVHWKIFIFAAVFSIVGSFIGAKMSIQMDVTILKKIFAVFLIIVAIRMWIK